MTVGNQVNKVIANGNGSTTVFSFSPMELPDNNSQLQVTFTDASGNESVLVEGTGPTNYSVSVSSFPGTGSITYPADEVTPIAAGTKVTMKRLLTLEQQTDLENRGGYFADTQELQFDRFVMIDLQQQEELDRVIKGAVSDADTVDLTLPAVASRASKFLGFDSSGNVIAASSVVAGVTISSFAETFLDDASATAVFDTLLPNPITPSATSQTNLKAGFGLFDDVFTTRGDILRAGAAGAEERLALPSRNLMTGSDGTDFVYFGGVDNKSGTYTVLGTDHNKTIFVDGSGAGFTINLTAAAALADGFEVTFVRTDDTPANLVTIDANASETINGALTYILSQQYDVVKLVCDGSNWHIKIERRPGYLDTKQASTSGTEIDFTNIPATATRITIMFEGVSTSGTVLPRIELGDSGGIETSGYLGTGGDLDATPAFATRTDSFVFRQTWTATNIMHGILSLVLVDASTNTWAFNGQVALSNTAAMGVGSGTKSLSGTLTQVRISAGGVDTFDAGNINIKVE